MPALGYHTSMIIDLPVDWLNTFSDELQSDWFDALNCFVDAQRQVHKVFPAPTEVFNSFKYSPFARTRVVIIGQDPYHEDGQAHGLAFSVPPGVPAPPSLVNIYKELSVDIGCPRPQSGCLIPWARQGVLLLNTIMTVRAHNANSHKGQGWERFTDTVIERMSGKTDRVVFLLWGAQARAKSVLIDKHRHIVIESPHPSPLSASRGFFGSHPFSRANDALQDSGQPPINWAAVLENPHVSAS